MACQSQRSTDSGEGGIRTRERACAPYSLSRRVPSATRPPLREADSRIAARTRRDAGRRRCRRRSPRRDRRTRRVAREAQHARYEALFAAVAPPFAFVDLDALGRNAARHARRGRRQADPRGVEVGALPGAAASGSSSLDPRLPRACSPSPLPETLWLAEPGLRRPRRRLPDRRPRARSPSWRSARPRPGPAPVAMVDCAAAPRPDRGGDRRRARRRCGSASTSTPAGGRLRRPRRGSARSARRSAPGRAGAAPGARRSSARPGTRLAGADGLRGPDRRASATGIPGRPLRSAAIRAMQTRSDARARRAARRDRRPRSASCAELEFVNGGGTGSLARTAAEDAVTELDRRLGLLRASALRPLPLARPHARRRSSRCRSCAAAPAASSTALGGGYLASGAATPDRLPEPYLPEGLASTRRRAPARCRRRCSARPPTPARRRPRLHAPRQGRRALRALRLAATWSRATQIVDEVPTYRGEGQAFL